MSTLTTTRLTIRTFAPDDLAAYQRITKEAFGPESGSNMESWIQWTMLSATWLARKYMPPYGDRAITLSATGELIGAVGYVPLLAPFEQIPELRPTPTESRKFTPEFGLFWVIDTRYRRQGYATEAAQAMIVHAFTDLRLKRIVATTEFNNLESQCVMKKLGMTLTRNPLPEPPWLQVVGVLDNSL